jgi:phage terminase large subunit-like protein
MGLAPTLCIVDELHAHRDDDLYIALRTSMLKRAGAKMLTISTAEAGAESPLGQLRARALAQPDVRRISFLTDARGPHLRMLDWQVPPDADMDDPRIVKKANPASFVTVEGLAEQREAVQDHAFRRLHANQVVEGEGYWLPAGAWQTCAGDATIEPGERVWSGSMSVVNGPPQRS